jgi:hypothetical protein
MTLQIEVGADNVTVETLVRPQTRRARSTDAPAVVLLIAPGVASDKQVAGTMRVVASDRLRRCRIGAWAGDGDE